jgi:hypothetical protein
MLGFLKDAAFIIVIHLKNQVRILLSTGNAVSCCMLEFSFVSEILRPC